MKNGFLTTPTLIFILLILPALLFAGQYRVLRAAELLPNDQQAQVWLCPLCLNQTGEQEEPDSIVRKAIDISPYSEISKMCRAEKTKIAQHTMQDNAPNGMRMDVVMYCKAALAKFKKLGPQKTSAITGEIALLGRQGLDINNPNIKYTLKSLDGKLTGLQFNKGAAYFIGDLSASSFYALTFSLRAPSLSPLSFNLSAMLAPSNFYPVKFKYYLTGAKQRFKKEPISLGSYWLQS